MNLFTKQKQTHRHRKQTHGYQRGKDVVGRGDKLGVWDQQIQTTIYKIGKQQTTIYKIDKQQTTIYKIDKQQ